MVLEYEYINTHRLQTNEAIATERNISATKSIRPAPAATSGKVVMPGPFIVLAAKTRMAEKERYFGFGCFSSPVIGSLYSQS